MKRLFKNITSDWLNNIKKIILSFFLWVLPVAIAFSFKSDINPPSEGGLLTDLEKLEAGWGKDSLPESLYLLQQGEYSVAKENCTPELSRIYPWLAPYLEQVAQITSRFEKRESSHFVLYLPPEQLFLADYALSALEKSAAHLDGLFRYRPQKKIRVEIYENKSDFSLASTLSLETLERSGAIGICKFHRLMVLSPLNCLMGYRWLDALSHEYVHLLINEMTDSRAELWFHEGTARYFETSYRSKPPHYLSPQQKTILLEAYENKKLIPFERMSPSMVYLKDQEEVSLAFAQVAFAIDQLVKSKKISTLQRFMTSLKKIPFWDSFKKHFSFSSAEFQNMWVGQLSQVNWKKTKGALADIVHFQTEEDQDLVGADAQGLMRIGDRMKTQGAFEPALVEYEKALLEEPDNPLLLLKAAKVHLVLKDPSQATEKLKRAIDKNPNYGTVHLELANLLEGEEALYHYLEANAINPFNPAVHQGLSNVYSQLGRKEDALKEQEILRKYFNR